MDFILLLADTAKATDSTDPRSWLELVLGPMGVLVVACIYAWYTEKRRMPKMSDLIADAEAETNKIRSEAKAETNKLRADHKVEMGKVYDELTKCREKYTKESRLHAWWQAHAKAAGVTERPEDIDRTSYGSFEGSGG